MPSRCASTSLPILPGTSGGERFLITIATVHDLPDLARRPITLRMIADEVELMEQDAVRGRPLHAADLYESFVHRWLDRDADRHALRPEHKRLLMEYIAAGVARDGRASWTAEEVEDRLLTLFDSRRDLQRRYPTWDPDRWVADLRAATFLSRSGDDFTFAHRSFGEYFLARYLCERLAEPATETVSMPEATPLLEALQMPVPGHETLDFLGQSIAALLPDRRAAVLANLARIAARYTAQVSELALAYALRAERLGYPRQRLDGVVLAGAKLAGWHVGGARSGGPVVSLADADLSRAQLRDAVFVVESTGADLSGADLTGAEFHDCRLDGCRLAGAQMTGTILRDCTIEGVDLAAAIAHRAQALRCRPAPEDCPGWLVAPRPSRPPLPARLNVLVGHGPDVLALAYSPDGVRLAVGGRDGSVHVWDPVAAQLLHQIHGGRDRITAVAYHPDGRRLAVCDGEAVRVWDVAGGLLVSVLSDSGLRALTVAYRPDGSQLAVGGHGRAVTVWDTAAETVVHRLLLGDHDGPMTCTAIAYSPDGSLLTIGGVDAWRAGRRRRPAGHDLAGRHRLRPVAHLYP